MVTTREGRCESGGRDLDRLAFAFDDQRVVANAGLVLARTLAGRLGIERVVDETVDLGARRTRVADRALLFRTSAAGTRGGRAGQGGVEAGRV